MLILLTRPRDDTTALADKLKSGGHAVLSEPMLEIRFLPDASVDLSGAQALLFTSANGVRAFAARESRRDLPVFAVGDATAAAARAAGFARVESAAGRVEDLAGLVRDRLAPADGVLVHAAGRDVAGDLTGMLAQAGFQVRRAVLYAAEPVRALSAATSRALKAGEIDVAIFYSARTAGAFARLIEDTGLAASLGHVRAVGLSAAALEPLRPLPWAGIEAAARPDETEVMRLLAKYVDTAPRTDKRSRGMSGLFARLRAPKPKAAPPPQPRFLVPMVWLAVLLSLGTFFLQTSQPSAPPALSGVADLRLTTLERRVDQLARTHGQPIPDQDMAARLKALSDHVDALGARQAAPTDQRDIAALSRRIDDLQSQLAAAEAARQTLADQVSTLQTKTVGQAGNDQVQHLSQQVTDLQKQAADLAAARQSHAAHEGVLLAAGQVALAAASGAPVAPALAALRPLTGDDPRLSAAIAELAPVADRAVPSVEVLTERFPTVATAVVRAARREAPGAAVDDGIGAWWQAIMRRLSSTVTVRRVGDVTGESPDARVARAEQRLAAHDLQGAVDALSGLTGAPASAVAGWLDNARARLALDKALGDLSTAAIAAAQPPS